MTKTPISTHWINVDGYVAAPDDSMEWIVADDDTMTYENDPVASADTLLLGRITYGDFAGYWPKAAAQPHAEPYQNQDGPTNSTVSSILSFSAEATRCWTKSRGSSIYGHKCLEAAWHEPSIGQSRDDDWCPA
jgi:dihydrofolate reductase